MHTNLARTALAFLCVASVVVGRARAQCLTWDPPVSQGQQGSFSALVVFDEGTGPALHAGGGTPWPNVSSYVARLDGGTWTTLGAGVPFHAVTSLAVFDAGSGPELYAGTIRDGFPGGTVLRWDGSSWTVVGGFDNAVHALLVHDDGTGPALYAGGSFEGVAPPVVYTPRIARWNGSSWSTVGGGLGQDVHHVYSLATAGSRLYAGGSFFGPGMNLASWNGTSWTGVPGGVAGSVRALVEADDGSGPALYVAGDFASADQVAPENFDSAPGELAVFDDGGGPALYAAGFFTTAGGNPVAGIARWDGASWFALGANGPASAGAMVPFDDGGDGDEDLWVLGPQGAWRHHGCGTQAFCFGDGTIAACPCANYGASGRGCENSASTGGAVLAASGSSHPDTLVLTSSGELPSALSIFLQGDAEVAPLAFGDGLRCAGGNLKRLYSLNASAGTASAPQPGDPSISERSAALGDPIAPGSSRFYQVYYRDPDLGFCASPAGSTFNASNALRVVW